MLDEVKKYKQQGNMIFRLWLDNDRKIIAYRNGDLIYIFNFHPQNSYDSFAVPIHDLGDFKVILDTDQEEFGGLGRIAHDVTYTSKRLENTDYDGIEIYIPSRTAMVLKKTMKITCLGDSFTEGFLVNKNYTRFLKQAGFQVENLGINGNMTGQMLDRLPEEEMDTLIVFGGTNDFYAGLSPQVAYENIKSILKKAKAKTKLVIIPPYVEVEEAIQSIR